MEVRGATLPKSPVRIIAFYLPQFHPIPENNEAWGHGFTEWTNVTRAKPLFDGHYQPQLPTETGFYDLRLPEILCEQAELARQYGVHGFCYYFYWFDGRRVLERPIEQMLHSGQPDFPFCLCWANENWTRRWDGSDNDVIIPQNFERRVDIINDLIPYFRDPRYIRVEGRPLFLVYRPDIIPDLPETLQSWRATARERGMELFLAACLTFGFDRPLEAGFDSAVEFPPHATRVPDIAESIRWNTPFAGRAHDYEANVVAELVREERDFPVFRTAMAGWDNSPRRGCRARIFVGSSIESFELWLSELVKRARANFTDHPMVFVNAWNEWAEGAHLEPDDKHGRKWLEACARAAIADGPPLSDRELAQLFGQNPHVHLQWAFHLQETGRLEGSAEAARGALALDADSPSVVTLAARILGMLNLETEAIKACRRALIHNPENESLNTSLTNLLIKMEKWEEALSAATTAVKRDPSSAGAHLRLGIALARTERAEKALRAIKRATELGPEDAASYYELGRVFADLGRWTEARAAYQEVLARRPDDANALKQLSLALAHVGNIDEAVAVAERVVALKPDCPRLNHHFGNILAKAKRWEDAQVAQRRTLDVEPHHVKAMEQLSHVLAKMGDLDEAVLFASKAVHLRPASAARHHHLGNLLAQAERWQEASDAQRSALALEPQHAGALRQLQKAMANSAKTNSVE